MELYSLELIIFYQKFKYVIQVVNSAISKNSPGPFPSKAAQISAVSI